MAVSLKNIPQYSVLATSRSNLAVEICFQNSHITKRLTRTEPIKSLESNHLKAAMNFVLLVLDPTTHPCPSIFLTSVCMIQSSQIAVDQSANLQPLGDHFKPRSSRRTSQLHRRNLIANSTHSRKQAKAAKCQSKHRSIASSFLQATNA